MSNTENNVDIEDIGHNPQYIGEYFLQQLRREITFQNYGNNIEKHFFKMLCFYYFDIDKKTSLKTLQAYEQDELDQAVVTWKSDIIVLLGQHLYDLRKIKGLGKVELYDFIKGFALKIISTITQTEQFAKICHELAIKMRKKWGTTHNTLITKNTLHTIIGVNSFSTLQHYLGTKGLGPTGHTNPYIYTPYTFGQAHIDAIDTLSYFLGLDQHTSVGRLIESAATIRKLLMQENTKKTLIKPQHSHVDIAFDNTITNDTTTTFIMTYTNQQKESSDLYALLDTCFDYIPENSAIKNYDKNEYIYHSLQYLQNIHIQSTPKINHNSTISKDTFLNNLDNQYGEYIYSFFDDVVNTYICTIQSTETGYLLHYNSRKVHITTNTDNLLLEYQVGDHILGEQCISYHNSWIVSPYTISSELIKIKRRSTIFGITEYIEKTTGKCIDEFILDISNIIQLREKHTPKLDNTIAYMQYLLLHTINPTIDLSKQQVIDYIPSKVPNDIGGRIQKEIFMNYAHTLSYELNKRYISKVKKDGTTPISETSKKYIEDVKSNWNIINFSPEAIYEKLQNDKNNTYNILSSFLTFIQQEERISKSIETFEGLKNMTPLHLVKQCVLNKITLGIKNSAKNTHINLKSIYPILEEYNIISYLQNGSSSKVKDTIINHIHQYVKSGIYSSTLKLLMAEKKIEDENNRIQEAKKKDLEDSKQALHTISTRIDELLYTTIQKKYIHKFGLIYWDAKIAIKKQNKDLYNSLLVSYNVLKKDIIQDCILCGLTETSPKTIEIVKRVDAFPIFEITNENDPHQSKYSIYYYEIKKAIYKGYVALQENNPITHNEALAEFEDACSNYKKWYYDRYDLLGNSDNTTTLSQKDKTSRHKKKKNTDKIRKTKYIDAKLESYNRDFPYIKKDVLLPLEANFITTLYTIKLIGAQAVQSFKKNNGKIDIDLENAFHSQIEQISDYLYTNEGISKDSKLSEHKNKIRIMKEIDLYTNAITNLLPRSRKNNKKVHASSKYKAETKILCYKALDALCNNNIHEYENLHQAYISHIKNLEKALEFEDASKYQSDGIKRTKEILRKHTMDYYNSLFPSKQRVGLDKNKVNNDTELYNEIIECEYSKLPIYTKNALNKQVTIRENGELSTNRSKDFLDVFYHSYDSFRELPIISDTYAKALIGDYAIGQGRGGKDMMKGYIKKHCMYTIELLCNNQCIEDYIDNFIHIEDKEVRNTFITKWKELLKTYLLSNKEDALRTIGTYEHHIFHTFLDSSPIDTGVISGKIAITVPNIDPVKVRMTDIDTIDIE